MFERFTDRARRVVVLSQEASHNLHHSFIGTEHVLLGLLAEGEGVGFKVLTTLGIRHQAVREQVEDIVGVGDESVTGHVPFTPRAKRVLELGLREALQLGHSYIGTEHILLGLVGETEGVATQILDNLEVDTAQIRPLIMSELARLTDETSATPAMSPILTRALPETCILAGERDHRHAGTDHLMLWLLDQSDSGAVELLEAADVDVAALRACVAERLAESGDSLDPPHPG